MTAQFDFTATRGYTLLGSETCALLTDTTAETVGVDRAELHTDANAASIGSETNTTTTFTSVDCDTFQSQSGTVYNGTYAIEASTNVTPTADARFYKDIATDFNLVVGNIYELSMYIRHVGSGGTWYARISLTNSGQNNYHEINNSILSTDTTFEKHTVYFKYDGNQNYLVFGENSASNDGGIFLDSVSCNLSNEKISNSTFNIEQGTIGYWVEGSGGSITGGALSYTGGTGDTYQDDVLTLNESYVVTYTLSNYSSGSVRALCGSGGTGTSRDANGTYTETITCSGSTRFSFDPSSFTGDIDNVSVRPAETDESGNGLGAAYYGQLSKAVVATGSDLVTWSGFSDDDYLKIPYNSNFDPGTGDLSVVFDINMSSVSGLEFIFKRDSDSSAQYYLCYISSGTLYFVVYDNTTSRTVTSNTTLSADTVYKIALTYDASEGTVSIYINSALDNTQTGSVLNTLTNTSAALYIGKDTATSSPLTNGSLSNMKFYIGTLLTKVQIQTLYNNEKHLFDEYSYYTKVGSSYSLTTPLESLNRSVETQGNTITAWNGRSVGLVYRDDENFTTQTTEIALTDMPDWREFLHSTRGRAQFTFTPGDGYYPNKAYTVEMTDSNYVENRVGTTTYAKLTLKMKTSV